MRAKVVSTVGDIRVLLKDRRDDEPIGIAACPDVNGFVNPVLGCVGEVEGEELVILALGEETLGGEMNVVFRNSDGEAVRPV